MSLIKDRNLSSSLISPPNAIHPSFPLIRLILDRGRCLGAASSADNYLGQSSTKKTSS